MYDGDKEDKMTFAVLWILVLLIAATYILILGHCFGEDVYDAAHEIIKDFAEETVEEENKDELKGEREYVE